MRVTDRLSLPFPERPDTADVPRDVEALAEAIDIAIIGNSGPFSSRPAAGLSFRIYRATDLDPGDPDYLTLDTGSTWISIAFALSIPDRSINHVKLQLDTLTADEIGPNAVGTDELITKAVTREKINDKAVGAPQIGDELKPSAGASNSTEALRKLGTETSNAAKGSHKDQHSPSAADALNWPLINMYGTFAGIPAASAALEGLYYFAKDFKGGQIFQCQAVVGGYAWITIAPAIGEATALLRKNNTTTSLNTNTEIDMFSGLWIVKANTLGPTGVLHGFAYGRFKNTQASPAPPNPQLRLKFGGVTYIDTGNTTQSSSSSSYRGVVIEFSIFGRGDPTKSRAWLKYEYTNVSSEVAVGVGGGVSSKLAVGVVDSTVDSTIDQLLQLTMIGYNPGSSGTYEFNIDGAYLIIE